MRKTNLTSFRRERELAFTIIEVLVAILILGVLTAIAVPSYANMVQSSKDQSAVAEAVVESTKFAYPFTYSGIIPQTQDLQNRSRTDENNMMALVSDGTSVCLLAYNSKGKEYTADAPYVIVNFKANAEGSSATCPLDTTSPDWR